MVEGGGDFDYQDDGLDWNLDHDNGDDEQEVNTTRPFQPGAASTPYHSGKEIQMQTRQHEQTRLPETSYEETPLLTEFKHQEDKPAMLERAKEFIRRFPRVNFKKLWPISFSKKGAKIFKLMERALKSFTDKFSSPLGPWAEEIIDDDHDTIREERQRLLEAENPLKQTEALAAERKKNSQEMQELRKRIDRTQARIDALQEEQGTKVESEAELFSLNQGKRIYKPTLKMQKRKWHKKNKQTKKTGINQRKSASKGRQTQSKHHCKRK